MKGKLFAISGPSGVGKNSVLNRVMQLRDRVQYSVSATSRPMRPGEIDGKSYYFVTREQFEQMIAAGELLEHAEYVGNYYGTLRSEIEGRMALGIPVILVIEVEGAGNIKKMYPGATTIFVLPPDMEELERRLRSRGTESEETIRRRLQRAETEIANSVNYDEHIVNNQVEACADSLYSIIQFKLKHGAAE